jgi:deazaflavin-dependent oxidoreductase (nitroreductase family)
VRRYRQALLALGRTRWFTWISANVLTPIDRFAYRRSGGRVSLAHLGGGEAVLPTLLLTTTGRRSGQPRTTPVLYVRDGERLVVVASNFGREHHPAWSANLLANPEATVQVRKRRERVRARRASDEELARLWPRLLEVYPTWADYTKRTDRDFRAFFLDPVA